VLRGAMHLRSILAVALAALAVAPASAVAAPTLQPLKACYVAAQPDQREPITINASGFTPYRLVDVYLDDVLQPAGDPPPQADANGDLLNGSVAAPYIQAGQRVFSLQLSEQGNPANTVVGHSKVTALSVEQVPAKASTGARVRFRGRGFTGAGTVWAHYVFGGSSRKTVRVAKPYGDCGLFSRKMRQFPFKKSPKVGVWTIQFDQQRRYSPAAPLRVPLTVKVNRTIRPKR
jgi:hypothetical protein